MLPRLNILQPLISFSMISHICAAACSALFPYCIRDQLGRFLESNSRRTAQRKTRRKIPKSPSGMAKLRKIAMSLPNVGPDVPKRNVRTACLHSMLTIVKTIRAIAMPCTIVSFCLPLARLRQSLPSFWAVSGNTVFRCRALISCCHSSRRLLTTNLADRRIAIISRSSGLKAVFRSSAKHPHFT